LRSKVAVFVELWHKTEEIKRQGELLRLSEQREQAARARDREREAERRHLAELAASEARFRRVVESNIFGVVFWDKNGRITEANEAFLHMVGYTHDEVQTGKLNWRQMTPAEYRSAEIISSQFHP
jgi:PAS domain-containing protein